MWHELACGCTHLRSILDCFAQHAAHNLPDLLAEVVRNRVIVTANDLRTHEPKTRPVMLVQGWRENYTENRS